MISDESRFALNNTDFRTRVDHRTSQSYGIAACWKEIDFVGGGGGSLMVSGGRIGGQKTDLVIMQLRIEITILRLHRLMQKISLV